MSAALLQRGVASQHLTAARFLRAAPGISASPSEDNLRYFNVMILGPSASPYEGACRCGRSSCLGARPRASAPTGGVYKLELFLPEEYPMAPPKVRFVAAWRRSASANAPRAFRSAS